MTSFMSTAAGMSDGDQAAAWDDADASLLATVMLAVPPGLRDDALRTPLADFLGRPGKHIRGTLARMAYRLAGGRAALDPNVAAVVELLHAGSLIVDDIEDAALVRRGRPALHHLYGTPRALNAANWLYFAALQLIDRWPAAATVRMRAHRRAVRTLLRCHEGQALDLTARVSQLSQQALPSVVRETTTGKSAALLALACWSGAVTANADAPSVRALARFGRRLGVALQMYDDVAALYDDARQTKCHEDLLEERPTWPWAWLASRVERSGFEYLQSRVRRVAARELHPERLAYEMRRALGEEVRARPGAVVRRALGQLANAVGPSNDLLTLRVQIARWERTYV